MEEEATSEGTQAASRSWKGKKLHHLPLNLISKEGSSPTRVRLLTSRTAG